MDFEEIAWILERKLKRILIRRSTQKRPSSEPFISGDSFRALADHLYEKENIHIKIDTLQKGDIIFVESNLIEIFFNEVHPRIPYPYVLITHNGDKNIDSMIANFIDEKIIHWFAQNLLVAHPKITPIPIGLENAHYANAGMLRLYQEQSLHIAHIREGEVERIRESRRSRILYTFNTTTNPKERTEAQKALKDCDVADKLNRGVFICQPAYIRILGSYTFVASPPGNGEDCHRTWEALYTGTIPIVKESALATEFSRLGIPLFLIQNWEELQKISKYELMAKYDLLWQHSNIDTLYFDFWKNLILSKKE
jgi:hypothetical protein